MGSGSGALPKVDAVQGTRHCKTVVIASLEAGGLIRKQSCLVFGRGGFVLVVIWAKASTGGKQVWAESRVRAESRGGRNRS